MSYNYNPLRSITNSSTTYQTYTNPSGGQITSSYWTPSTISGITTLAMSSNGTYQLAISSVANTLYLSIDNGTTWTNIYSRTGATGSFSTGSISANGKYILVGINGGYIYLSTNFGATFTNINTNSPIIYLPCDTVPANGSTTQGSSPSTLTVVGPPTLVTGIVGTNALNFTNTSIGGNPTQYISGTISNSTNFTISFWFNQQTVTPTYASMIFSMGTGSVTPFQIYTNTSYQLTIQTNDGLNQIVAQIALNTWYNITIIYQSSVLCSVYLNGVLLGSSVYSAVNTSFTTFAISRYTAAALGAFSGYIDDLQIYNNAIPFTPINAKYTAISGTGQYMAVAIASGGLWLSVNYGSTWTQVTSVIGTGVWTGLSMSHTGQYMLTSGSCMVSPNTTYLSGNTSTQNASYSWTANGVTWTASASSSYNANYNAWVAFNNSWTGTIYSWASASTYLSGAYNGSINTNIIGVGVKSGEWLQIQSSVPLVIYSYNFACGVYSQIPKTYYIVGSNDATNWYPIQYVTMSATPFGTTSNITATSAFILNQAGIQKMTSNGGSGTLTIQTYSTTTNAYNYFRLVGTTLHGGVGLEIAEWYLNFVGGQSYSTNYGSSWINSINTQPQNTYSPTMTGLSGSTSSSTPVTTTWTTNGITWSTTCSAVNNSQFHAWNAFNNSYNSTTQPYSYASPEYYTSGVYNNTNSMTVQGLGTKSGEWIQITCSTPLVMTSYSFACRAYVNVPKTFYILGSNDGSYWYLVQDVTTTTNPYTVNFTSPTTSSFVQVNMNGTQSGCITPIGVFSTTTTANTTFAYTYYRFLTMSLFSGGANNEFTELFLNFTNGIPYTNILNTSVLNTNIISPNMYGLGGSLSSNIGTTWTTNGVTWTVNASTTASGSAPYFIFDNGYTSTFTGWYNAGSVYNNSYTGSVSTPVYGIGAIKGEYVQLQSSIPLILYSYNIPNYLYQNFIGSYYFVGSNDSLNWYPIHYAAFSTNPWNSGGNFVLNSNWILANYTGNQTYVGNAATVSLPTISYSTSTNSYTYFRMICTAAISGGVVFELIELYLNFINSLSINAVPTSKCLALSANGQYAIGTTSNTLISHLQFEGGYTDTAGGLTNTTGVSTNLSFSSSIYKVGTQSLFCNNTAGGTTPSYANYTLPSSLYSPSAITISLWVYPTSYPASNQACPLGFNNGTTTPGSYFSIVPSGLCYISFYTTVLPSGNNIPSLYAITLNAWSHLTATFLNGIVSFYINGILQGSASFAGTLSLNTGANMTNMFVGALETSSGAAPFGFAGYIDDIRIYSKGLTVTEVITLYNTNNLFSTYIVSNYLGGFSTNSYSIPNYIQYGDIIAAASSNTGQYMVLITGGTTNNVYYSTDYGGSFTTLTIGSTALTACAINYDGSYITVSNATTIYILNNNTQGNSIAYGSNAGQSNQGTYTIALGANAGQTNQTSKSIILNTTGSALNSYTSGFYVAPISTTLSSTSQSFSLLGYGTDNQIVQSGATFTNSSQTIYGEWIQLQLLNAVSITSYTIQARYNLYSTNGNGNRTAVSWYLLGSTDGSYWSILDNIRSNFAYSGSYALQSASDFYTYYRLVVTQIPSSTSIVDFGGLILYNNNSPIFPAPLTTSAYAPYSVSGINNNILSLNSVVVCTVTWSWQIANTANTFGIKNDDGVSLFNPGMIPVLNAYLTSSNGSTFLGFLVTSIGSAYEYNGYYIATQGTSTVAYKLNTKSTMSITGSLVVNGTLTSPIDTIAQAINLTPSATNSAAILQYISKVVNTVTPSAGVAPFWANDMVFSPVFTHGQSAPAYKSGVLLPNGNVVCTPASATYIGVYNPNNNTFTSTIAHGQGTNAYYGGVLLPNGNVVMVPYYSANIGIYNSSANTFSATLAHGQVSGAFVGGVLLPNSNVLFVPYESSTIGIYNYNANTFTSFSHGLSGGAYFQGGVLLPNGNVIFVPYNASNVGIFNSSTTTFTSGAAHGQGSGAYNGGVLLPNGNVLFVPNIAANIGIYNPISDTFIVGPSATGYLCGVLLPNGNVILAPYDSTNIGVYNYITNVFTFGPSASGYTGVVLLPNGNVLFMPNTASTFGILTTTLTAPREFCLSPYYNKM